MYNENSNCVTTCDSVREAPKPLLSDLLAELNSLSESNLSLAIGIRNIIYGNALANEDPSMPITCMEDSIKNAMALAMNTNEILVGIRDRL